MKIAGALFAPREDNKDENKAEVAKIFAEAEDVGARLLIFPEMTLSGFTMNHALYDPSDMEFFEKLAEKYGIATFSIQLYFMIQRVLKKLFISKEDFSATLKKTIFTPGGINLFNFLFKG